MKFQNDPSRYLICGTNAYKPQCREYVDERGSYNARGGSERSGIGVAPFSYKVAYCIYISWANTNLKLVL